MKLTLFQGQEPFIFLQLFDGNMVVAGEDSGIFYMHGSSISSECYLVELQDEVILRSHAIYIIVNSEVTIWYGGDSDKELKKAALKFANKIVNGGHPYFKLLKNSAKIEEIVECDEKVDLPVIKADNWTNVSFKLLNL